MNLGPIGADGREATLEAQRYLDVTSVSKQFGSTVVLKDLDLAVRRSEFVSLLGPSGCGKTTLLRLIAGLLKADGGSISIDGRDLTRVAAHKRNIGVVFQNYALFPHLTVEQNVAFGLEAQRTPRAEIATRVEDALALVRMREYAGRRIAVLSGGQQQRVAVARAIAVKPTLLLLDEPFSALDRKLRETMQIEMRHLLRDLGITSIFVTHDQDEALVMSDRVAVMNEGRIEHLGTPDDVYRAPRSLYVLEFVGQSTLISGTIAGGTPAVGEMVTVETPFGGVQASTRQVRVSGTRVVVGVRPEAIQLGERPTPDFNQINAKLVDVIYFGSKTVLHFGTPAAADRIQAEVPRLPTGLSPGAAVTLCWPIADTMVYPAP